MRRIEQPGKTHMTRAASTATIMLFAAGAVFAQPQDTRLAYEAASVKINTSGTNHASSEGSKGQLVMTNQTLKRLIERAYNVNPLQVAGPGWMEDVRFDIVAKYPQDTKNEERLPMLRTLLEDRFKLVAHRETKEMSGWALVVAKGGFKLKPAAPGQSQTDSNADGKLRTLTVKGASMAQMADLLARLQNETVVDRTGIEGVYDFELHWTMDDLNTAGTYADVSPSVFAAIEETLGLKLQRQKVPVEVIVVDSVERVPIEN